MKKVVYLPLDERPCNAKFPVMLFDSASMRLVSPPALGSKKTPADAALLEQFLLDECRDADGLVLSVDTLLYGGLIPSRLHALELPELHRRLNLIRELKSRFPALKIAAFQVLMRCPTYSSDDEEPPYYQQYGAEIHRLGAARHKASMGDPEAPAEAEALERQIPPEALADYTGRRAKNLSLNLAALDLVADGVLDFMVCPQDDSRPLGFTAMDQARFRAAVRAKRLQQKVFIYPGSDDLGLTMMARMKNTLEGRRPSVYVNYASEGGRFVVPLYEDRPLGETIRWQLAAAGLIPAATPESADFIMGVTAPPANMAGAAVQPRADLDYDVRRSLVPWFDELCYWMDKGKPVSICDNAYGNGGDLELLALLDASGRLLKVAGYAGWNTSSNTMGTTLAMGVRYLYEGADVRLRDFLALRYVEDIGYGSVVRQDVIREDLPGLGLDYFNAGAVEGEAAACVKRRLRAFADREMPSIASGLVLERVRLPWARMFEVDLDISWHGDVQA